MKREAPGSTKLKQLCRHLDCRAFEAIGILESIWHLTAREAPQGDIGKLSDEDISIGIDYHPEREKELIEALVKAKWLDRSQTHRLLVHDWHEHADDTTDVKLARSGRTYANTAYPRMSKLSKDERAEICSRNGWDAHKSAHKGTAGRVKALPEPEPEPRQGLAIPTPGQAGPSPRPEPGPEPEPEPVSSSDGQNCARRYEGFARAPRAARPLNDFEISLIQAEACNKASSEEARQRARQLLESHATEVERVRAEGPGP